MRRRAIDHGLEREGVSVFTTVPQPDGSTSRVWQASGPMQNEVMDDNTLDHHVADVLQAMPELGRAMVMGNLKAKGIKVSHASPEVNRACAGTASTVWTKAAPKKSIFCSRCELIVAP